MGDRERDNAFFAVCAVAVSHCRTADFFLVCSGTRKPKSELRQSFEYS